MDTNPEHTEKKNAANAAVDELFEDTSVDKAATLEALTELQNRVNSHKTQLLISMTE